MRFGEAIDQVTKHGYKMRRQCWDESHFVGFQIPDGRSKMTGAYFYQSCPVYIEDHVVDVVTPWSPDVFDMTGHDWEIINEE